MKKTILSVILLFSIIVNMVFVIYPKKSHAFEIKVYDYNKDLWYHVEPSTGIGNEPHAYLSTEYYGYYWDHSQWFLDEKGRIQSGNLDLCLDVDQIVNGGAVVTKSCSENITQKWEISGNEIRALSGSDFCLDVPGADFKENQKLQIWPCNNTRAQRFVITSFTISTKAGGYDNRLYLSVDPTENDLMLINSNDYNGWEYGSWFLDNNNRIRESNFKNQCLDYPWSGRELYTYNCHNGVNQRFSFSNGQIRGFGDSEFCVEIPNSNFVHGQKTRLRPCASFISQKWIIE